MPVDDTVARAEDSVLGGLIIDASRLPVVEEYIGADDFLDKSNRHLFLAIKTVIGKGFDADPVSLLEHINGNGALLQHVATLAAETPSAANIKAYCEIVKDASSKRLIKQQLNDALKQIDSPQSSLSGVVELLDHGLTAARKRLSDDSIISEEVVQTISASSLVQKTFPEPRWAVEGLIPEGVTLLAGKPKMGKSWLALNIGMSIGLGGKALGRVDVQQGDVLYLALEDTERRLQERVLKLGNGGEIPDSLHFCTKSKRLNEGGINFLDQWADDQPSGRLIIVDTLAKFRTTAVRDKNMNMYTDDYSLGENLSKLAMKHGIAILVLHHLRKADSDDPLDTISGTLGCGWCISFETRTR